MWRRRWGGGDWRGDAGLSLFPARIPDNRRREKRNARFRSKGDFQGLSVDHRGGERVLIPRSAALYVPTMMFMSTFFPLI
ncbi:hypothetical protein [Bradyrhizobium sp. 1(2017)]|jgi:hypothetical protein|uniref:hypothetical protein n=1 Tax=Bradyrhizobium sp. 1(2017) TaxID=1404888 RepID=UPI00140EA1BE|nr:hypothetical protein [Bradyrhizobium sp. 1(2017)]QIO36756.1 hypothetical protein HAP40_35605 [Bradyrhizobium sp. 1(2017)]